MREPSPETIAAQDVIAARSIVYTIDVILPVHQKKPVCSYGTTTCRFMDARPPFPTCKVTGDSLAAERTMDGLRIVHPSPGCPVLGGRS